MKVNHQQVEMLIAKAIAACSYDSSLSQTKFYLAAALQAVSEVSGKRSKNYVSQKQNEVSRLQKHKNWWDMIKKNALDNFTESPDHSP